ncbi:MAG: NAD-dependent epimerase/dehydratase family protein [Anaerolineaceae bacterium]|nr:NAD-dependent epimerase/dehydratase family protein [Anaerolineaceae bacterium]
MKILVTGAGGFLGRGLIVPFEGKHELRLMDVFDWETPHEKVVGSVADLETVRGSVDGVQAIVIAHMASRQAGAYDTPVAPFDVNVKGTANLFFAGLECGIKRYVLISGEIAVWEHKTPPRRTRDLPLKSSGIYGLTKVCQEVIAEQYQREFDLQVAVLRVGYVLSADDPENTVDKYGKSIKERNAPCTDRRDIGEAARLALELPDLGYEVFYVLGAPEAAKLYDVEYTHQRLGWKPKYDFTWLPEAKKRQ